MTTRGRFPEDALRPHLTVIASDLVAERDGHLVIGHRSSGSPGGAPQRVRVRATPPVRAVLDATRSPVLVADLASELADRFPAAGAEVISRLIRQMVSLGFLLTSLRAPMTSPDPLAALLAELDRAAPPGDAGAARLRAVSAGLARHNTAPSLAAAGDERKRTAALTTRIRPAAGPTLAIDLRLNWDLTLPETVAAEAAAAAGILVRLARRPVLSQGWAAWHARFLDRYGPGAVVPVLDATDDSAGLGFPDGYLGSRQADRASSLTERDRALARLAQRAVIRGEQEITLDDALVAALAVADPGDPVQPTAELTVRVHAASIAALDAGRFTLHVLGVSRGAGTVTGRFLGLLDGTDRERMRGVYSVLPGVHEDSLLAQISAVPLHVKSENVGRVPQVAGLLISLGEHRTDCAAQRVPVSDLAVTADARRLHLVSVSRCRAVHTILPSAVDLTIHSHPLARFLLEAPVALAVPCTAFDWGAASLLPFVPGAPLPAGGRFPGALDAHCRRPSQPESELALLGRGPLRVGRPGPSASTRLCGRRRPVPHAGPGRAVAPGAAAR